MTIGKFAREVIIANPSLTNQEVLDKVKEAFPEGKTTIACIAWYKSDMKKKGYKAEAQVPAERTVDMIQAELEATKLRVMELEEELETKLEADKESMMAKLMELAKQLNIKVEV